MNRSQFQALYEQYGFYVYKRCLRLLGHASDAEDAMHDVFIKVMTSAPDAAGDDAVLRWLNRVVTNHCLNALRHAGVQSRFAPVLAALPDDDAGALHALLERQDLVGWLLAAADEQTTEIVGMYFFDEYAVEVIASELRLSVPTVRRRLRGFVHMAQKLAEHERPGGVSSEAQESPAS